MDRDLIKTLLLGILICLGFVGGLYSLKGMIPKTESRTYLVEFTSPSNATHYKITERNEVYILHKGDLTNITHSKIFYTVSRTFTKGTHHWYFSIQITYYVEVKSGMYEYLSQDFFDKSFEVSI